MIARGRWLNFVVARRSLEAVIHLFLIEVNDFYLGFILRKVDEGTVYISLAKCRSVT